jgi:hypothetical protein
MPSFTVTINTNVPPAVSVTMTGNVTYGQFKNSLGQFVYEVNKMYIFSNNQSQISQIYNYSKYDSDGNQNLQSVIPAIDPFQNQPSLNIELGEKNIVIDGRDFVDTTLLPNSTLQMKLYVDKLSSSDKLNKESLSNFDKLENAEGDFGFFENYTNYV